MFSMPGPQRGALRKWRVLRERYPALADGRVCVLMVAIGAVTNVTLFPSIK